MGTPKYLRISSATPVPSSSHKTPATSEDTIGKKQTFDLAKFTFCSKIEQNRSRTFFHSKTFLEDAFAIKRISSAKHK